MMRGDLVQKSLLLAIIVFICLAIYAYRMPSKSDSDLKKSAKQLNKPEVFRKSQAMSNQRLITSAISQNQQVKMVLPKVAKTKLGKKIELINPFLIPEDENITCVPLRTVAPPIPICTFPSNKDIHVSFSLNTQGTWEPHISGYVMRVLRQNPAHGMIELGTNLGFHAITAASMGHTVVGCEAFYPNIKRLAKTMRINKHLLNRLRIVPYAVSDRYEEMSFAQPKNEEHLAATMTNPKGKKLMPNYDAVNSTGKQMTVDAIRTDDLLQFVDFKRAILKADIEHGEFKAFHSAFKIFESLEITHVFLEWSAKASIPEWRHFFVSFFKHEGYKVFGIVGTHENTRLTELDLTEKSAAKWPFDVVFIKNYKYIGEGVQLSPKTKR